MAIVLSLAGGWSFRAPLPAQAGPEPPSGGEKAEKASPLAVEDGHIPIFQASLAPSVAPPADHFGYALQEETVGANWVDASGGAVAAFKNNNQDDGYTEAIPIGFGFKFYEHTYTHLYISTNGLITFDRGSDTLDNERIPLDTPTNNTLIAPFWDDLSVKTGKVFYRFVDGVPGSRAFVIEWFEASRFENTGLLTFEVILRENGDILFQYLDLNGILDSATVGIEDEDGVDGLPYLFNAAGLSSGKALRIARPAASARAKITPSYQSNFLIGGASQFKINIHNTGERGPDIYALSAVSSRPAWTMKFYALDGVTPLVDTNGDGKIDTGPVEPEKVRTVLLKVRSADDVLVGEYAVITTTVTSSVDSGQSAAAVLQTAVPSAFVQASADSRSGMQLSQVWQHSIYTTKVSDYFFTGNTLSIVETPALNYIYVWEKNGDKEVTVDGIEYPVGFSNIEYTVLSRFGSIIRSIIPLTDYGAIAGPLLRVDARYPAVAAAPDGTVAVFWVQFQNDQSRLKINSNVYFALIDQSGKLKMAPVRLSANDGWQGEGDLDIPLFGLPQVTATEDNRFFFMWIDNRRTAAGEVSRLNYAIYSSQGEAIQPAAPMGQSTAGQAFLDSTLTDLNGSRVLAAYSVHDRAAGSYTVAYAIFGSDGDLLYDHTLIPGSSGWRADAIQFSSGNILLAWTDPTNYRITAQILNGDGELAGQPSQLPTVKGRESDFISLSEGSPGKATMTWMDSEWNDYLYYALIDSSGTVLTPPMIFSYGTAENPLIQTSYYNQGNAAYSGSWRAYLPQSNQKSP